MIPKNATPLRIAATAATSDRMELNDLARTVAHLITMVEKATGQDRRGFYLRLSLDGVPLAEPERSAMNTNELVEFLDAMHLLKFSVEAMIGRAAMGRAMRSVFAA